MRLKGKVALVTGSSRGIGKAIARKFAEEGASVVITYKRNRKMAEEVRASLKGPHLHEVVQLSLENPKSVDRLFKRIIDRYGRLDVLVNNAATNKPNDLFSTSVDEWDEIMKINLRGPFLCAKRAMEIFIRQRSGVVINISSVSGQYGGPRTAHYAASKAGLIALTKLLARYGGPYGVRANAVSPGLIQSEMAEAGLKAESVKKAAEQILLNRLGTADEVANAVAFLASDEASYITGHVLNVNGGLYMG
ncbi:MAG TPA: 3-oxoacyl-ACP reductase FabG [Proteobacteria bacterium]|nr:3-oxoacyl-ACP reductase FabG [Pseudomonadota bacterium]